MKTFELDPSEFVDSTNAFGHDTMAPMPDSHGRTWWCVRCGARVYRLDESLSGWALEYTCDEVMAVRP